MEPTILPCRSYYKLNESQMQDVQDVQDVDWELKRATKRSLSFLEDSYEWDSIREKIPPDVDWHMMKCDDNGNISTEANELLYEWVPYGYMDPSVQKSKKRRSEANTTAIQKTVKTTISDLEDENEHELAAEIISELSEHAGSLEFENLDKEAYSRILPFPPGISDERMSICNKWRFDQNDCQMESLLSKKPRNCPNLSFRPWSAAQRRQRKYEISKIVRDVKMENMPLEDGEFCWTTFTNIIKPLFMPMEPQARYTAANHFANYLKSGFANNK